MRWKGRRKEGTVGSREKERNTLIGRERKGWGGGSEKEEGGAREMRKMGVRMRESKNGKKEGLRESKGAKRSQLN